MTQTPPIQELRELARLLDAKFKLPFGLKIGWDGILGLVPVVGDSVTNLASIYILYKAAWLGCPPSILMRMGINIIIDNVLDLIPLFGNLADFFWKSNLRNIALIESYVANPARTTWMSRLMVIATLIILTSIFLALGYFAVLIVYKIWLFLQALVAPNPTWTY